MPHLAQASDAIEACVAGMDRGGLLLAANPLDQARSASGLVLHVDEQAPFVVAWRPTGGATAPVFIVPTDDPERLLADNLTPEGESWRLPGGPLVSARRLDGAVAFARDAALLEYAPGGAEGAERWRARWGAAGRDAAMQGDVLLAGSAAGIDGATAALAAMLASDDAGLLRAAAPLLLRLDAGDQLDAALLALDFDPLGIVGRLALAAREGTPLAALARGGPGGSAGLAQLAARPTLLAASIDLAGLVEAGPLLRRVARGIAAFLPEELPASPRGAAIAVYRSPSGLAAGLLGDAVVVLETATPAPLRDAVAARVRAAAEQGETSGRVTAWREELAADDRGTLIASGYETRRVAEGERLGRWAEDLLFGPLGPRGFVAEGPGSLVVTSGRRPETLRRALEPPVAGAGLDAQPAIRALRGWMPERLDAQAYLDVAALLRLVADAADAYPFLPAVPRPDAELPPVAVGVAVGEGASATTFIVPGGVAALLVDAIAERLAAGEAAP